MRKSLVFICISGLFLLGLTGISEAKVTISIWDEFAAPPARTAQDATYEAFQKAYPEINIAPAHFENTPYEWVLKTAFAGGEPPNIAEVNPGGDLFDKVRGEVILDITDFVRERLDNRVLMPEVDFKLGGKYWGVPLGDLCYGNVIWHNTDILRKYGISADSLHTWTGFTAACEKLKNQGVTPIAFGNKEAWNGNHWWTHLVFALLGKEKFQELALRALIPGWESELKFDDPAALKAWELYAELWEKGYFSPGASVDDYPTAYTYFLAGRAGFFQTGGWFLGIARYNAPDFPLGYTWFPRIEGYPGEYGSLITSGVTYALTTNNTPETKEAALTFLDWVMTEDTSARIRVEIGKMPPAYRISLAGLEVDPLLKRQIEDAARASEFSPFIDHLMDFDLCYEHTWIASQGILTGDLTPLEAARTLEKAVQEWQRKHPEKEILPSPSLRG